MSKSSKSAQTVSSETEKTTRFSTTQTALLIAAAFVALVFAAFGGGFIFSEMVTRGLPEAKKVDPSLASQHSNSQVSAKLLEAGQCLTSMNYLCAVNAAQTALQLDPQNIEAKRILSLAEGKLGGLKRPELSSTPQPLRESAVSTTELDKDKANAQKEKTETTSLPSKPSEEMSIQVVEANPTSTTKPVKPIKKPKEESNAPSAEGERARQLLEGRISE